MVANSNSTLLFENISVGYLNKGYPQSMIKKDKPLRKTMPKAPPTKAEQAETMNGTPQPCPDSHETHSMGRLDHREISDSHDPGSSRSTHLTHQL
jgi:hypothetical protein